MKRSLDMLLALLALIALSPLFLLVGLGIAAHDGFPVFFRQTRVGKDGHEFGMYKFRSMVRNAARQGPYYTVTGDPRITPLGRFIRRTSIDELPQLINVLKGDMSLVGPRPDVPVQRGLYTDAQWKERCSVRPGITGLAQAKIRSEGVEGERLALDLYYVRHHSLWLDIKIMLMTLRRLSGKGSN